MTTRDLLSAPFGLSLVPSRAAQAHEGPRPRQHRRLPGWWGLWLVLGVGAALRIGDLVGYSRALMLYGDSYGYLIDASRLTPSGQHPLGYPLFLAMLRPFGSLTVVPVVQHLLGLGLGLGIYLLLRRLGVRRGFAVLGTVPVLLDPYQVQLEQFVLAETWTSVLVLLAFALVFLADRPPPWLCGAAGLLIAVATLSRTIAGVVLVPLLATAAIRRWGWLRPAALAVSAALPLLLYAAWFHSSFGKYGLDNLGNRALYGRTATIANCAQLHLGSVENRLCDPVPLERRNTPNFYAWEPGSPLNRARLPKGVARLDLAGSFDKHVIESQPLCYGRLALKDFVHYFGIDRVSSRDDWPIAAWQQQRTIYPQRWHVLLGPTSFAVLKVPVPGALPVEQTAHSPVRWLRAYQKHLYVPGWAVALAGVLGLAAAHRFRADTTRGRGARLPALTGAAGAFVLLLVMVPALSVPFDFRYLIPAQLFAGPAFVGALELWRAGRVRPGNGPPLRRTPLSPTTGE